MQRKNFKPQSSEAFERHQRKCTICNHPDREVIEEEFLHWHNSWGIYQA